MADRVSPVAREPSQTPQHGTESPEPANSPLSHAAALVSRALRRPSAPVLDVPTILAMQTVLGNQAVRRIVDRARQPQASGESEGDVETQPIRANQRPSETVQPPIRRQPDPNAPTPSAAPPSAAPAQAPSSPPASGTTPGDPNATQAASLVMGSITVTTFDGLLSAARLFKYQLTTEAADVPTGEQSRTAADDLVTQEQGWEPYLQSKGSSPLDQAAVAQATVWYKAYAEARQGIENYKKAKARADMEASAAADEQARAAADKIPEQLADYQRGAFLAKDDALLEKLTNTLGKALQFSSALLEIHEKCMEMVGWLSNETSHVDELIEKFGPIAEAGHKVVAAAEGLSAALTILRGGEGATEVEQTTSKASAGLGLAGAAGSLTGMASAYMLYFGALLSVGQACLKVVGVIAREHSHEFNKLFIAEGQLNNVDWSAEPGGRETFDFMVKVMHAGSSTDIPTPVPEAVDKLIVDSGEEFNKGTGEEVPTTGFWFWKHADADKLKYWLMKNRNNVWAMLYGSISPPP